MSDEVLKKLEASRRQFIKKIVGTAAFATPMLLSFDMNGPSLGRDASAQCFAPNSCAGGLTNVSGGGHLPITGSGEKLHFAFTITCDPLNPTDELSLSWKDGSVHHEFTLTGIESASTVSDGFGDTVSGLATGCVDGAFAQVFYRFTDGKRVGLADSADLTVGFSSSEISASGAIKGSIRHG